VKLWPRIREKFRHGLVLMSLTGWVGRRLGCEFMPYLVCVEEISGLHPSPSSPADRPQVEPLASDALREIGASGESDYSTEHMLELHASGCLCLGVRTGGRIAGWVFCDLAECRSSMMTFPLLPHQAYFFGLRTLKSARGRGVGRLLRSALRAAVSSAGRSELLNITNAFNTPARRLNRAMGARPQALHLYLNLWRRFRWNIRLKTYPRTAK